MKTIIRYVLVLMSAVLLVQPSLIDAAMEDYCLVPPYVKTDVKPNVLIIIDNALGMSDRAYTDPYVPTTTYAGYFKSGLMYKYMSPRWEPSATAPTPPDPYISGNLLNWATTSQYDLLESILVGGISTSRQTNVNTLVSKSNVWTATLSYTDEHGASRTCLFVVNNANVEIKDDTGGSCGYLDSPYAHPIPGDPMVASIEPVTKFALVHTSKDWISPYQVRGRLNQARNDRSQDGQGVSNKNLLNNEVEGTPGLLSNLWFNIINFLIPDAEAKPLAIGPGKPTDGTECTAYSYTIAASGGSEIGYVWSITAGSLPPGLSLTTVGSPGSGVISGTPTTAGTYTFTVRVTDSLGATDTKSYSGASALTISAVTLTITTSSPLSDAMESVAYSTTISTNGVCSTGGYVWSITAGSLPFGLSLNSSTGVISGIPAGEVYPVTHTFTVQVVGYGSHIATKTFNLTVQTAPVVLTITTTSPLPDATKDSAYTTTLSAINGTPPYTWSITSGSLPSGLSLNSSTGVISGTPTTATTYNFTVQVRDNIGTTATKGFSVTVNAVPVRTTGNLNVKICVGDYALNCTNAGGDSLKSGIVDELWPQARLGVQDFNKQAGEAIPNISNCIEGNPESTPDSNFLTAIENAVPIDPTTTMVDAAYTSVDYYATNTTSNCDPFRNSQSCLKSFILMITNGVGADNHNPLYPAPFTDATHCSSSAYKNLSKNTCYGYNNDLRNSLAGRQYVSTYIVNTMGTPKTPNRDWTLTPITTGDILYQAANAGGGVYYEVVDPATLKETLERAFQDILKRAAAGTAASVLASGEGSGANLIQAVFYPRRKVNDVEIDWTGRLTNFWYYVDPFFSSSSIYEDNASTGVFNLTDDNKVTFYFDTVNEKTMAHRFEDDNDDGVAETAITPDIEFENLNSLWEAGLKLWSRTSARTIKTWVDSDSDGVVDSGEYVYFSTGNASAIRSYLNLTVTDDDLDNDGDVDDDDASILIRYIHGEDFPLNTGLRSRTVTIGSDTHVWKLGDILNSTPRISSWIPLNTYNLVYKDTSYGNGTTGGFINTTGYKNRGMVVAGGNDGMLHAFKLGTLEVKWTGQGTYEKARLTGSDLGEEMWAFIPKNTLPYLKYIKEPGYCHVYTIDLTPYVFDASIGAPGSGDISDDAKPSDGSTWRTVLIGGMRYGGACKPKDLNCATNTPNCVCAPAEVSGTSIGYSSYFALDITDQSNPTLLWEFSDENLGFTTTGPTIMRIGPDKAKNGKWFVVFGSGPTGPISTSDQQFLGRSNQSLKLFVLDLKTGALLKTFGDAEINIPNAFAGSMVNSTMDTDLDYQDDVVYIGYVKKCTNPLHPCELATWTDGGVGRLLTKEDTNPSNWVWSQVMDGIGPVTASVGKLLHKNKGILWLFFGTGRYYFEQLSTVDDETNRRTLFGIKEPCYETTGFKSDCTSSPPSPPSVGSLTDVTDIADADPASITNGWKLDLDAQGNYTYYEGGTQITRYYRAERVITDPLATSSGLVFFTTYKPYSDVCSYGGKSFIWAVKYSTGGAPGALLKGVALLQVSTGSIEQLNLSSAFTEAGGRKTSALEGVPPTAQGLSILSTPPPVKRVLHIRER